MIHADHGVPCVVGNRVTVGHRVILHGCTIEDDCLIGMGSIVLNGAQIGRGCVIGAGARAGRDCRAAGFACAGVSGEGRPRARCDNPRRIEHAWVHYVDQARRHRAGDYPTFK